MGYIQTKAAVRSMQKHGRPASVILIEDKANGPAIVEELQADPDFGASVIAVDPQGDKVSRANAASTDVEAGSVYLPEGAEWVGIFVRTFAAFPGVRFDDDVDSLSQFINWRRTRNFSYGVLDRGKRILREIADGIRDAWGELISKPQPKPVAVQARAQKEARMEGKKRWEEKVPPCPNPDCKSTCTAWHSDGKGGVMIHCRQCGRDDGKDPGPNLADTCPVEGCGIKLQTRGGNRWCQNHGIFPEHRPEDPVPPPGISRRAHFARLGQYAIRGPRGRF
jgi:predicted phage terminase large subunit-like protein